jgi:carbamoyltransferase
VNKLKKNRIITLGINSFFEHPSIALIENGNVIFAAEDERFTGIKHGRSYNPFSAYIPFDAIYQGLKYCGLTSLDISEVSYSYSKWKHLRNLFGCFTGKRLSSFKEEFGAFITLCQIPNLLSSGYQLPQKYRNIINPKDFKNIPFVEWPHHLCHAASAFYTSGWDDALVVIADGAGESACTTVYYGNNLQLKSIDSMELPNSLGHFYSNVTKFLGFEPFSDEFKVMGLAAYGEPKYVKNFEEIIELLPKGRYKVNIKNLQNLQKCVPGSRQPNSEIKQIHKDVARSAQFLLEKTLLHVIKFHAKKSGKRKICLAGGVFLNCVANEKIAALPEIDDVFVQPASSDAGTALGAACLSYMKYEGNQKINCDSMALGTSYSDSEIELVLKESGLKYKKLNEEEMVLQLAKFIHEDKICAIFKGRMEFGPRALGMRSVLANPTSSKNKEKLNKIKDRESFRPVAPIVTSEAFNRYFEGHKNPYMLFTCRANDEAKKHLPSSVHTDNSSRVQTINKNQNPFLHKVLLEIEQLTAHPCIINTSFNIQGKPIVEDPTHAISCFLTTEIDVLILESFIIEK